MAGISLFLALAFVFAYVSRVSAIFPTCPVYGNCAVKWNIESSAKKTCCNGQATVRGCRSKGSKSTCWCDSYISDTCSAQRNHKCPGIKRVKSERKTNVDYGHTLVSQMKSQVNSGKLTMFNFFEQFFMKVYKQSYEQDKANLQSFNALMSQSNPPAPDTSKLGNFLFSILKSAIALLPGAGATIGTGLTLVGNAIQITTNAGGGNHEQGISWRQFLQAKAQGYTQAQQKLEIGLWSWTQAYFKKNKLPSLVKKSSSSEFRVLEKLINNLWGKVKTQRESYINFIASYMNSVGAGFIVGCQTGNKHSLAWGITLVSNSVPLMRNLMSLTENCLNPGTNFKDNNGVPVAMGLVGSNCKKTGTRTHCSSGVIPSSKPIAITSKFTQTRDAKSGILQPALCAHKHTRKFPVTYRSTSRRNNIAHVDGTETSSNFNFTLPLAVTGVALGVALIVAVVVVVVLKTRRTVAKYTVDEEAGLAARVTSTNADETEDCDETEKPEQ